MPSSLLILCHPLLLLLPIPPRIRVFSNEPVFHIRWPKYWSFNFSISPCNEDLRLISFRMDWLDLLAVRGTLKSLLKHRSSKASILRHSAFFIVQFAHPYMTTGKTIVLTRRTFVGKKNFRNGLLTGIKVIQSSISLPVKNWKDHFYRLILLKNSNSSYHFLRAYCVSGTVLCIHNLSESCQQFIKGRNY